MLSLLSLQCRLEFRKQYEKVDEEEKPLIDFGSCVMAFTKEGKSGSKYYEIAPPSELAEEWDLQGGDVTLKLRAKDGAGRLWVSDAEEMDGHLVMFHGFRSKFEWREKRSRAVAKFTPLEMKTIVGT